MGTSLGDKAVGAGHPRRLPLLPSKEARFLASPNRLTSPDRQPQPEATSVRPNPHLNARCGALSPSPPSPENLPR